MFIRTIHRLLAWYWLTIQLAPVQWIQQLDHAYSYSYSRRGRPDRKSAQIANNNNNNNNNNNINNNSNIIIINNNNNNNNKQ